MAVLMISDVQGQTPHGYDSLLAEVGHALTGARGLVLHLSHPTDDGWRVVEVWDTREDAAQFFAAEIAPRLPDGVRPKMRFHPLHDVLHPDPGSQDVQFVSAYG
jgi:hypothetical protein